METKGWKGLRNFWRDPSGHVTLGRFTLYGENAMHWAVNIYTKRWGYICFRLPLRCFGYWWALYFYVSRDATPSSATVYYAYDRRRWQQLRDAR